MPALWPAEASTSRSADKFLNNRHGYLANSYIYMILSIVLRMHGLTSFFRTLLQGVPRLITANTNGPYVCWHRSALLRFSNKVQNLNLRKFSTLDIIFWASSACFGRVCAQSLLVTSPLLSCDIMFSVDLTVAFTRSALSTSSSSENWPSVGRELRRKDLLYLRCVREGSY